MQSPALIEIRRLSSRYCNEDTPGEERAAAALIGGKAAYWSTTSSTNVLSLWRDYVNKAGSIGQGLAAYRSENGASLAGDARLIRVFLDKLIPLNKAAVTDLGKAYETLAGTFFDADELRERNYLFAETSAPAVHEAA